MLFLKEGSQREDFCEVVLYFKTIFSVQIEGSTVCPSKKRKIFKSLYEPLLAGFSKTLHANIVANFVQNNLYFMKNFVLPTIDSVALILRFSRKSASEAISA